MSYDVHIGAADFNCTFNLSKMFYDHIPDAGSGGGLKEIADLTGKQALPILARGLDNIQMSFLLLGKEKFDAKYDAPNKWGSALGGLLFLARVLAACAAHPRHRVRVHM